MCWWNGNNRFYHTEININFKIKISNELIAIKIFCTKINSFLEIIINRNIPYPSNIIETTVIDT